MNFSTDKTKKARVEKPIDETEDMSVLHDKIYELTSGIDEEESIDALLFLQHR